ncbi:MAG: dephospho-CoA kinase [Flavobacteriales bacterium]|nr:dephospho-CoA kinase [Flavobacteriales bacterium]
MSLVLGVTGGIGSGKTTVCKIFSTLGVPVFYSDVEAKKAYQDPMIQMKVRAEISNEVFVNGELQPRKLADIVFNDRDKLEALNEIIHPYVAKLFAEWRLAQNAPYLIKEAAILFESGAYRQCDHTLLISCQETIRVQRVMERDGASESEVRARMSRQWSDERKRELAGFEIVNDGQRALIPQIMELHNQLKGIN